MMLVGVGLLRCIRVMISRMHTEVPTNYPRVDPRRGATANAVKLLDPRRIIISCKPSLGLGSDSIDENSYSRVCSADGSTSQV